jgi:NTP pyrophosphatase (non-canonical NTP hydrolase)
MIPEQIINKIYQDFIDSGENQLLQFIEESGELNHELLKSLRGNTDLNKIEEEVGDVLNALYSVIYYFELDINEINSKRQLKLKNYHKKLMHT